MSNEFDIQKYMIDGVERVVKDAVRAAFKHPEQTAYLARFAVVSKKASAIRASAESRGEHIPPFLIASITSNCNLHCKGCYSRENGETDDYLPTNQLTACEWYEIFSESDKLGISFILLAGGEPLLRKDVILEAVKIPDILFPIFTNGVFMNDEYFTLFAEYRNLVPVMSIEGGEKSTDSRRGKGIYARLIANMYRLKKEGIFWGASVTVTSENVKDVTSEKFIENLSEYGCKAVIYVEYVPVIANSSYLTLNENHQKFLRDEVLRLRRDTPEIVFISFPGDEITSDGCVAAGRGFFHINSRGGAEPCPFSPFSDINVKETSIREALRSPLFRALQTGDFLKDDHVGGCTLFMKKDKVENLMQKMISEQSDLTSSLK